MKYDYKQIIVSNIESLQALGDEGWELVTVDAGRAYFKKAKKDLTKKEK